MKYRLPDKKELFSIPNIMSYFRILLLPFLAYAVMNNLYLLQLILLFISALTDFLDGKIARRFNMVTELGKALDPVADKLTLCVLFICLAFENDYVEVIAIVMTAKEFYMGVMQLILMRKCKMTTGGAKWYGKLCTATLFIVLGIFLLMPQMTALTSNIIMVITVWIMLFTGMMYAFLFKDEIRNADTAKSANKVKSISWKLRTIKSIIFSFLFMLLYIAAGVVFPFVNHLEVSDSYSASFDINDYVTNSEDGVDRVRLVTTNDDALKERLRLIEMAQDSIILSTFEFRADESGIDVISKLYEAANRGVDIKIIVDGFAGMMQMDGNPMFQSLQSMDNVTIKIYNPVNVLKPWNLMGRMHDKYLIVDDYGYLLGGRNTYNLFLGNYNSSYKNYDMEVFVWNKDSKKTSSLYQVKDYFNSVWNLSYSEVYHCPSGFSKSFAGKKAVRKIDSINKYNNEQYKDYYALADNDDNTYAAGAVRLISNPVKRSNKEPQVWETLYNIMSSADERIYLHTPYIICSKKMYSDLNKIGQKDIEKHIVLNAPEIGANPFGCSDFLREKSNVLDTGFSVYEYMGPGSYHAKALIIDDNLSIIGSFNGDMRSTYLDTELMLSIESEEINRQLSDIMSGVEEKCKHTVTEDSYELPDGVKDRVMSKSQKIKYKIINFITKPIRFLL